MAAPAGAAARRCAGRLRLGGALTAVRGRVLAGRLRLGGAFWPVQQVRAGRLHARARSSLDFTSPAGRLWLPPPRWEISRPDLARRAIRRSRGRQTAAADRSRQPPDRAGNRAAAQRPGARHRGTPDVVPHAARLRSIGRERWPARCRRWQNGKTRKCLARPPLKPSSGASGASPRPRGESRENASQPAVGSRNNKTTKVGTASTKTENRRPRRAHYLPAAPVTA